MKNNRATGPGSEKNITLLGEIPIKYKLSVGGEFP
jgi:hypothetical protein